MPPYTKYTWVDEVLTAAARYNILEDGGSAFKSNMQINLATSVTQAGSSLTASRMNNIESELKALSDALLYKINPSVATNDLTIALTHADGTAPSSTRPLYVRINDTWYSFTAATTYTKTDGANWHNAGSTELAGKPIDFFLYAIAETGASAGAKIGHSRICHAKTMADFVNTNTSEKYIAGNWTNFNSTDKVEVIGRFRAQLSASPSYNWSIASALVINRPIYETGWLSWAPTPSANGSMTYTSVSVDEAVYQISPEKLNYIYRLSGTTGGTASNQLIGTLPFGAIATNFPAAGSGAVNDGAGAANLTGTAFLTSTQIVIQKYDASNYGLGTSRIIRSSGMYRI